MKKTPPQRVIDFICQKAGKLTLPKDTKAFLQPRTTARIRTKTLIADITVSARYSKAEIEKKIAEVKDYELSDELKEWLLEFEKSVPLRAKKIKKPEENRAFFKIAVTPRFMESELVRTDTLDELFEDEKIKEIFGLVKDVWPRPFQTITCAQYQYEAGKYKAAGGLLLPTVIPLPSELGTRFGKSELDGISLRFKGSAMGLEYVQITLENENTIVVGNRASYEAIDPTEMLSKGYELSSTIASLLIEEVR